MSNEPRSASGSAPQAAPPVNPVPAPSSLPGELTPTQKEFASKLDSIKDPAAMRALMDDLSKSQPAPPPAPADGNPPAAPAAADPAAPAADPAAGDPPAGDPPADPAAGDPPAAPDADPAPAADPDADPDPAPDGEVTPISGDRARLRLGKDDEVGRMAAAFKLRNKDWTLKECMEAAEKKLGVVPAKSPAADPAAPANPDLPQTVAAVDSATEQLEAQRAEAMKSLKFEEVADIDAKIRKLDRHRVNLERDGERQEKQVQAEYDTAFATSEAAAIDLYPDAGKPDSAFAKLMVEIEKSLLDTKDDRYNAANKPEIVAKLAAAELVIAPRRPGAKAPAPAPRPAAPAPKPAPKGVLPTGSSRTAPPPTVSPVAAKISSIKTLADLNAVKAELGLKDF